MSLTDSKIRTAKPAEKVYRLADRDGLVLEIRPSGGKFWRFRYRLDGKENMYAGGEYVQPPPYESESDAALRAEAGHLTLAEARQQVQSWRAAVKGGRHTLGISD